MQGSDPDMEGSGPSKPYGFEGPKGCLERLGKTKLWAEVLAFALSDLIKTLGFRGL